MSEQEAALLNLLLELIPCVDLVGHVQALLQGLVIDVLLNLLKQILDILLDALERCAVLLERVTAHDLDGALLNVARTQNQTHRHSLELVVGKLEAWTLVVGIVILDRHAQRAQPLDDGRYNLVDACQLISVLVDRHNDHLDGCQMWR